MTQFEIKNADWQRSEYALNLFASERQALQLAMRQALGPSTLQIGGMLDESVVSDCDLPYLLRSSANMSNVDDVVDLRADPAFLPFAPESFSTVILPHVLEGHKLPHQVLREAHRVLRAEGHLVLSGFNPISLLGMQRWVNAHAVFRGNYYTARRVIDWLQLLGFDVVASSAYQYAPLSKSQRIRRSTHFLESIGDRWLPMTGGGYMITAKKRDVGMTLVGKLKFKKNNRAKLAASPAKTALKQPTNQFINRV